MIVKRTLVSSDMRVFDYMFSNGILQMLRNRNTLSSSLSDLRLQRQVSLTVWS